MGPRQLHRQFLLYQADQERPHHRVRVYQRLPRFAGLQLFAFHKAFQTLQESQRKEQECEVPQRLGIAVAAQQHQLPYLHVALLLRAADTLGDRRHVPAARVGEQELAVGPPAFPVVEHYEEPLAVVQLQYVGTYRGDRRRRQQTPFPRQIPRLEGHRMAEHQVDGHPVELQSDLHRSVQGSVQ